MVDNIFDSLQAERHQHANNSQDNTHHKLLADSQSLYVLKPGIPLQRNADMQPQADAQTRKLYDKVSPAIVKVVTPDGLGSGFFFDKNGDIATDAHVVLGENQVDVVTKDGQKLPAKLVALDDVHDVAVLKVDGGTPAKIKPLELATNTKLKADDDFWALGHPLGLDPIYISPGYYQHDTRPIDILQEEGQQMKAGHILAGMTPKEFAEAKEALTRNLLQGKMHVEPGNSGGPVVDKTGKVIGMTDMTDGKNETEVTPVSYLASLINEKNPKFTFAYRFVPADQAEHKFAPTGEYIMTDESRSPGDYRPPYSDPFFDGDGVHRKPEDSADNESINRDQTHLIPRATNR